VGDRVTVVKQNVCQPNSSWWHFASVIMIISPTSNDSSINCKSNNNKKNSDVKQINCLNLVPMAFYGNEVRTASFAWSIPCREEKKQGAVTYVSIDVLRVSEGKYNFPSNLPWLYFSYSGSSTCETVVIAAWITDTNVSRCYVLGYEHIHQNMMLISGSSVNL